MLNDSDLISNGPRRRSPQRLLSAILPGLLTGRLPATLISLVAPALACGVATNAFGQRASAPTQTPPVNRAAATPPASAAGESVSIDDAALADRPIAIVNVKGLSRVTRQAVNNNLRVSAGQPFDSLVIREDVATLYRLGQFSTVTAEAIVRPDGAVEVVYTVVEQPIILEIGYVGNKIVSDAELVKATRLFAGGPRDDFLLEQSVFRIKELYRTRGNYLVEVTVDESRLTDTGILVFRIIEGPRVRIKQIEFIGNSSFDADKLSSQITTRSSVPLIRKGELDEERLFDDVAALDRFYKDMGFVDVRVDRRVTLSADGREAKVSFLVDEGRRYRVRGANVRFLDAEGGEVEPRAMSREQLAALSVIQRGDWFTKRLIERTIETITDAYLLMGYIDVRLESKDVRVGDEALVDLFVDIREGPRTYAGLVFIQGNLLTQDKVIRRRVRIPPGRPLDGRELAESKRRLDGAQLWNGVRVTAQKPRSNDEDPLGGEIDDRARAAAEAGDTETARRVDRVVRDVLVEVKEKNTGSINFGVGLGTDSGVFGEISLTQRNFDIADPPLTLDEYISGRAFRGAGQTFSIVAAPGVETSNFSVNFAEPHLFESDIGFRSNALYGTRVFDNYDQENIIGSVGLTRRLGDLWGIAGSMTVQRTKLDRFNPNTPLEVVASQGPATLAAVGATISRTDVDRPQRPTRGTELTLAVSEHYDLDSENAWTLVRATAAAIFTVTEDYLGRRSTLRISTDIGYIFGSQPPVYERFYLGGRSFRGFQFRTVSPKSAGTIRAPNTPNDQAIGGEFLFFLGSQYEVPLFAEFISGVVFLDSGTVTPDPSFDQYRVSVGAGLRLYLPQLGPAPLAFDFAYPLIKGEMDQTQTFSFAVELPF